MIKRLENIGEATKNIPEELKALNREVPWKEMAGMREVHLKVEKSLKCVMFIS